MSSPGAGDDTRGGTRCNRGRSWFKTPDRPNLGEAGQSEKPFTMPSDASAHLPAKPPAAPLRLVLVGRTGAGKSATGNTILGEKRFKSELSMSSQTRSCETACGNVQGRSLTVIDTPGLFDTTLSQEDVQREVLRCLALCSPGPHAVLLAIPIVRYTKEEQHSVDMVLEIFKADVIEHTFIIFTHADQLENGESIQQFIGKQDQKVQELVQTFGERFLGFDNKKPENREQVQKLLEMVDQQCQNGDRYFTNQSTKIIEGALTKMQQDSVREKKLEARKTAEACWKVISKAFSEERQAAERQMMRVQETIHKLLMDIEWEEARDQSNSDKVEMLRQTMKTKIKELQQMKDKEEKRKERERAERKKHDLWIVEEEKRIHKAVREELQRSPDLLEKLLPYLKGTALMAAGAGLAVGGPMLWGILAPVAPVVEVGLVGQIGGLLGAVGGNAVLAKLGGWVALEGVGAALGGIGAALGGAGAALGGAGAALGGAGAAVGEAVVPLLATQCSIQ